MTEDVCDKCDIQRFEFETDQADAKDEKLCSTYTVIITAASFIF